MTATPRICAVIPVFNHPLTILEVVRGSKVHLPVIVVDDGSTDETPQLLRNEPGITLVQLKANQGKGAALRAGFEKARENGFTHAITMDADGQHPFSALPGFMAHCEQNPEALISGVRDLNLANAPWPRRFTNWLSTFWFRFETGVDLPDTQCGYRVYPLEALRPIRVRAVRYAYELELLAKAAWAGVPVLGHSVQADYAAPTSKLSHFRPMRDFLRISVVHAKLTFLAICVPSLLRAMAVRGELKGASRKETVKTIVAHFLKEHSDSPARLACATGIGLFCGIAPIWGAQMITAAALAHRLRLNKALTIAASNISFPLLAPFILAAGLVLGHFLRTGQWMKFDTTFAAAQIPTYLVEWLLGSVVLALLAGTSGFLTTWVLATTYKKVVNRARFRI